MATYKGLLLAGSPYYITETGTAGFTSTIELRIWNGLQGTVPATADYVLKKQTLGPSDTKVNFEIGKLIETEFQHNALVYSQAQSQSTDVMWVSVKSYDGTANRDDIFLAVDGYSGFLDGINYNPTDTTLISERILYHLENVPIRFPVFCNGGSNAYTVEFRLGSTVVYTEDLSTISASNYSYNKVQYISYNGSTPGDINNILVKDSTGATIDTLSVKALPCSRYPTYIVSFINKFGANQELIFNMASKKSISIDKSQFNRQLLSLSGTPSYDTYRHRMKEYNTSATESITLNSSFIDETLNETISQLLASEYVWLTNDGTTVPVNVKTSSLDYKTGVNDGLVSYSIDLQYAYSKQNNIY